MSQNPTSATNFGAVAQPQAKGENWTIDQVATQLTHGYWRHAGASWVNTGDGTMAFDRTAGGIVTYSTKGLGAREKQMIGLALDAWSDATGLKFESTIGFADLKFSNAQDGAFAGPEWGIGNDIMSSTVNVGRDWLATYGTTIDSYTMVTYIHEIGHALGLGHAGNYNGDAKYATDRLYDNDSWSMSIMSYFEQSDRGMPTAYPLTPMLADLVATNTLYGGPNATRHGDTVYGVGSNFSGYLDTVLKYVTGTAAPNATNWKGGSLVAFTIVDTGGHNRINFSSDTNAQNVNLADGSLSGVYGGKDNMGIARGTVIHDYIAGKGSDSVTGNAKANLLMGMAGNDTLAGGAGNDTLFGGAGNDRLDGGTGNDVIHADGGNDTIIGGAGADRLMLLTGTANRTVDLRKTGAQQTGGAVLTITGVEHVTMSAGNDLVVGTAAANSLVGGAGNDRLLGLNGNDSLIGGDGNDSLYGGAGDDRLDGGAGNDVIHADGGNDTIKGGDGADRLMLTAGTGNRTIDLNKTGAQATGGATLTVTGIEHVTAGSGNDVIRGSAAANSLVGGAGNDALLGLGGNDSLGGGAGNDSLYGGAGDDILDGGAGNDVIHADGGNDTIKGGDGDDRLMLTAGTGNRTIDLNKTGAQATGGATLTVTGIEHVTAGSGNDVIRGSAAANSLVGGAGNDALLGLGGNDSLGGGAGNDSLYGGAGDDILDGGAGNDVIHADGGNDTIKGGDGDDRLMLTAGTGNRSIDLSKTGAQATGGATLTVTGIEHVTAGSGNDVIRGSAVANSLVGGAGNDALLGLGGNDSLGGGAGNDTLIGGAGRDVMSGGAGADVFVFTARTDSGRGSAADIITDFQRGADAIDLTGLGVNTYVGGAAFSGNAGEVRFEVSGTNSRIDIDLDGDRMADMSIVLTGVTAFDAGDLRF